MSTKRLFILLFVCHCEGVKTDLVIPYFPLALFVTITATSQLSMKQVLKRGMQGAEFVDLTIRYHLVHSDARLGDFS